MQRASVQTRGNLGTLPKLTCASLFVEGTHVLHGLKGIQKETPAMWFCALFLLAGGGAVFPHMTSRYIKMAHLEMLKNPPKGSTVKRPCAQVSFQRMSLSFKVFPAASSRHSANSWPINGGTRSIGLHPAGGGHCPAPRELLGLALRGFAAGLWVSLLSAFLEARYPWGGVFLGTPDHANWDGALKARSFKLLDDSFSKWWTLWIVSKIGNEPCQGHPIWRNIQMTGSFHVPDACPVTRKKKRIGTIFFCGLVALSSTYPLNNEGFRLT